MQQTVSCPSCRQPIRVHASLAGQVFACPHCRQPFTTPACVLPTTAPDNPFSDLNDDKPVKRRPQRGLGWNGISFVTMVAAIVVGLFIVVGVVLGGWYRLIYYPEMHDLESKYSLYCDGMDEAKKAFDIDDAAGKTANTGVLMKHHDAVMFHARELEKLRAEFFARYKRDPRYLKASERY